MESVVLSRKKNFPSHQFVFEAELHSQPRDAHMVVQVIWMVVWSSLNASLHSLVACTLMKKYGLSINYIRMLSSLRENNLLSFYGSVGNEEKWQCRGNKLSLCKLMWSLG